MAPGQHGAVEIVEAAQQGFDTAYMRRLFDDGYAKARAGALWETALPRDGVMQEARAEGR